MYNNVCNAAEMSDMQNNNRVKSCPVNSVVVTALIVTLKIEKLIQKVCVISL